MNSAGAVAVPYSHTLIRAVTPGRYPAPSAQRFKQLLAGHRNGTNTRLKIHYTLNGFGGFQQRGTITALHQANRPTLLRQAKSQRGTRHTTTNYESIERFGFAHGLSLAAGPLITALRPPVPMALRANRRLAPGNKSRPTNPASLAAATGASEWPKIRISESENCTVCCQSGLCNS